MKFCLTLFLLSFVLAGSANASHDRRDCKEELRKLNEVLSTSYTTQNHHGYRKAKASRDNEEYKKCATQARKERERLERDTDL